MVEVLVCIDVRDAATTTLRHVGGIGSEERNGGGTTAGKQAQRVVVQGRRPLGPLAVRRLDASRHPGNRPPLPSGEGSGVRVSGVREARTSRRLTFPTAFRGTPDR